MAKWTDQDEQEFKQWATEHKVKLGGLEESLFDYRKQFKNAVDEAEWHGAGFEAQEKFKSALDSPEGDLVTGIYKLLYPYTQKKFAPSGIKGGDIGGMERASGNKHVKELLAVSSIWDVLKGAGLIDRRPGNLNFTVIDGAPGLVFQKRF